MHENYFQFPLWDTPKISMELSPIYSYELYGVKLIANVIFPIEIRMKIIKFNWLANLIHSHEKLTNKEVTFKSRFHNKILLQQITPQFIEEGINKVKEVLKDLTEYKKLPRIFFIGMDWKSIP